MFIATTIDYLRHLRAALESAGRGDAVLIIDDPGPDFGLLTNCEFHRGPLKDYRDLLGRWITADTWDLSGDGQSHNVDGQLELQEFANIIEDRSPPQDCLDNT